MSVKTTRYNKLVRDRIPEIIAANGAESVTRTLTMEQFIPALKEKLIEEAREVRDVATPDELQIELADVLEVVQALAIAAGISIDTIEVLRHERAESRGGFSERVLLIETRE